MNEMHFPLLGNANYISIYGRNDQLLFPVYHIRTRSVKWTNYEIYEIWKPHKNKQYFYWTLKFRL